jgi:predicted O-methyltransferase YrrM
VISLKADNWQDVPGWLTPAEGGKLAELAAGKDVVELGAWCGRSTCAMSPSARTILSVDGFTGPADTMTAYLAYTNSLVNVSHYVGRFENGLPALADGCADLVFVDGQHDADSVERDSRIAQRLLRPGGTVAYHNYTCESVREGSARLGFRSEGVVDSLAWGGFQ